MPAIDMPAKDRHYLLSSDGRYQVWKKPTVNTVTYASSVDLDASPLSDQLQVVGGWSGIIKIEFQSSADGRGFSLLSRLRQLFPDATIFATGELNPDQLSMALQCGFDGVVVSEPRWLQYGEAVWQAALVPVVNLSYRTTAGKAISSIWQRRTN